MRRTSICYQTRLQHNDSVKVCSGTFGITSPGKYFDSDTIERLLKNHGYGVTFNRSGTAIFTDDKERNVRLYILVDPLHTSIGQEAHKKYIAEKLRLEQEELERLEAQQEELDEAMSGLSHEEVIRRLKGEET